MSDIKPDKPTVLHAQGFVHRPFVFEDFTHTRPARAALKEEFEPTEAELAAQTALEEEVAAGFSEEELLAAQKEAEEIGRQKGRAEMQQEHDAAAAQQNAQILALLQTLTERLDAEVAEQNNAREALRGEMAEIVLAIAEKLSGRNLETHPLGMVEAMVNECLIMLAGEARLSIAVCPALKEPLERHLATLEQGGEQVLEVVGDVSLQSGDCRIQWPGGKAARSQAELRREIEEIVERAFK